ncbi:MAG: hypothetical protein HXX18_12660 [Bacteroidetes bacterium]|nr:hypothetical protein [Bacteroidota bacterium]
MKFYLLLIFLILVACRKDVVDNTKDYREKFTGNYICRMTGAYGCMLDTNIIRYDSIVNVNISKCDDSAIKILDVAIKIEVDGNFSTTIPVLNYRGIGGYFIKDSIIFNTYQGGLGCHTILDYIGKKQ